MLKIGLVVASYSVASLWECQAHGKILHASKKRRQQFKKLGKLGHLMRRAYVSHELVHHRATFTQSFYQQFESIHQQRKLDNRLHHFLGDKLAHKIKKNDYGLTINHFWEMALFLSVPLLMNTIIFVWARCLYDVSLRWLVVVWAISGLPVLMSKFVHPLLHRDYSEIESQAWMIRLVHQPLLWLQNYHYQHHAQKYGYFNLCIGADWVFNAILRT